MKTQELKEYINKTLGNNIRCLLPAYWWKRLFGLVIDRVDEVEEYVDKTVEKAVSDIDVPSLATKDELSALENKVIENEEMVAAAFNDIRDSVIGALNTEV